MTNEEKLKKMSSGEFAEWICLRCFCPPGKYNCGEIGFDRCRLCWKAWLDDDAAKWQVSWI